MSAEALTCLKCRFHLEEDWRACPQCGAVAPQASGHVDTEILPHPPDMSDIAPFSSMPDSEDALSSFVSAIQLPPPPPTELEPGTVVAGRLHIQEMLGKGGMGAVYRAQHLHLRQEVAVKTMTAKVAGQPTAAERFLREARTCLKIRHPRVVAVLDLDRDPETGQFLLIMELCRGEPAHRYLYDRGRLAPEEAVRIIDHVLDGLSEAHRIGVVHRDIKPSNILVQDGPDGVEAKVLDFGLVRAVSEAAKFEIGSTMTCANVMVGTPVYMAPEQMTGDPVDARTDLFSTGVVLYELLTGRRPWGSKDPVELARLVRYEAPPPLRERAPNTPEWLVAVVLRALEKEPYDRYQTAAEFRAALHAGLGRVSGPVARRDADPASTEAPETRDPESPFYAPVHAPAQLPGTLPAIRRGPDDFRTPSPPRARPADKTSALQLVCWGLLLLGGLFGLAGRFVELGVGVGVGALLLVLATLAKRRIAGGALTGVTLIGSLLCVAFLAGVRPGGHDASGLRALVAMVSPRAEESPGPGTPAGNTGPVRESPPFAGAWLPDFVDRPLRVGTGYGAFATSGERTCRYLELEAGAWVERVAEVRFASGERLGTFVLAADGRRVPLVFDGMLGDAPFSLGGEQGPPAPFGARYLEAGGAELPPLPEDDG